MYIKDMEGERNARKFIAKFVGIILRNWDGQST